MLHIPLATLVPVSAAIGLGFVWVRLDRPFDNATLGQLAADIGMPCLAFANPEMYEFLEAEGIGYAIRLPANNVLQGRIGDLLKRPVGRLPQKVHRFFASFHYQAQNRKKPRRVVANVEWHPGEP